MEAKTAPGLLFFKEDLARLSKRMPRKKLLEAMGALMDFALTGEEPDIKDAAVGIAFDILRDSQERSESAYAVRVEKSRKAAEKRWTKEEDPELMPVDAQTMPEDAQTMPGDARPMPGMQTETETQTETKTETQTETETVTLNRKASAASASAAAAAEQQTLADFEKFWSAYPKKTRRPYALDAFRAAVRKEDISLILKGLERMKGSRDWKEEEGRFIPTPERWLREERWYDEPMKLKEKDPLRVIRWEDLQ